MDWVLYSNMYRTVQVLGYRTVPTSGLASFTRYCTFESLTSRRRGVRPIATVACSAPGHWPASRTAIDWSRRSKGKTVEGCDCRLRIEYLSALPTFLKPVVPFCRLRRSQKKCRGKQDKSENCRALSQHHGFSRRVSTEHLNCRRACSKGSNRRNG